MRERKGEGQTDGRTVSEKKDPIDSRLGGRRGGRHHLEVFDHRCAAGAGQKDVRLEKGHFAKKICKRAWSVIFNQAVFVWECFS